MDNPSKLLWTTQLCCKRDRHLVSSGIKEILFYNVPSLIHNKTTWGDQQQHAIVENVIFLFFFTILFGHEVKH